jgi:hypothetical protein
MRAMLSYLIVKSYLIDLIYPSILLVHLWFLHKVRRAAPAREDGYELRGQHTF